MFIFYLTQIKNLLKNKHKNKYTFWYFSNFCNVCVWCSSSKYCLRNLYKRP